MIKNKKLTIAASFCIGALMLVTTAFADISSQSGYDQLKNTAKFTAENCSESFNSFAVENIVTLKDNGNVVTTTSSTVKFDNINWIRETTSTSEHTGALKSTTYSYTDKNTMIWHSSDTDIYQVVEYSQAPGSKLFQSPFNNSSIDDMEKILDALVGSLKDYVMVDEKSDGSKELSGSLSEAQIPTLINALSSFMFKQRFSTNYAAQDERNNMPALIDDIFIKSVKGKAVVNKDGIMESLLATGVLSGKDKDGNVHDVTVDALLRITGINSTSITKPDLTGKKVETRVDNIKQGTISERFIGSYKNDIVIVKDDQFMKIGERIIQIAHIDGDHISGRYYEQYRDGYTQYNDVNNFNFDAEIKGGSYAEFKSSGSNVNNGISSISFNPASGTVYFNTGITMAIDGQQLYFDNAFSKIFD